MKARSSTDMNFEGIWNISVMQYVFLLFEIYAVALVKYNTFDPEICVATRGKYLGGRMGRLVWTQILSLFIMFCS